MIKVGTISLNLDITDQIVPVISVGLSMIVVFLALSVFVLIFGCVVYLIIQILDFLAFHFNYVLCAFIVFILDILHFDTGKWVFGKNDLKGFSMGGRISMSLLGLLFIVLLIKFPESVRIFD